MDRKAFLENSFKSALCCACGLSAIGHDEGLKNAAPKPARQIPGEMEFLENWIVDLLNGVGAELDEETIVKLFEACGRGCFSRHSFKTDLAERGKGDVDKLIEALKDNFGIRREGNLVHVFYGDGAPGCYCPVLNDNHSDLHEFHCYCTRATHQAIWETALGRPFQVDIVETFRRGGNTCHFIVHLD